MFDSIVVKLLIKLFYFTAQLTFKGDIQGKTNRKSLLNKWEILVRLHTFE